MANFVRHDACPKCKSEDNLAIYDDDSVHCFGCHYTTLSEDLKEQIEDDKPKIKGRAGAGQRTNSKPERKEKMGNNITKSEVEQIRLRSKAEGNNYRGIDDETLKIYKCRTEYDSDNEVKKRYYPVTKASKLVGYKQRGEPKSFAGIGNTTASCDLYGSIAFPAGGKYLLIVEGEEDAHAAFQMLKKYQQEKQSVFHTAVVSVTTGASGARKQLQNNYAFLNSFEQIIVGFDADDAGNDGLQKLVSVLPKGKVKVAKWSAKDPNMMLVEGMEREFVRDFYGAKTHVPAGVIGSDQLYARLLEDTEVEKIPFPGILKRLNEMLVEGISLGYIYNIAAGTGVGKCLGKGTPILMSDFTVKPVEDVKNGDYVMGPDGLPRIVSGVTSGVEKLYKIEQTAGMTYVVNKSHILSLRAGSDIPSYNLKAGDKLNVNIEEYLQNRTKKNMHTLKGYKADFNSLNTQTDVDELEAYILGLWLADGATDAPRLTIADKDEDLIEILYAYAEYNNYKISISGGSNCKTYYLSGGFKDKLREYGVLGEKHIPSGLKKAPYSIRSSLLAGFIDGDGYLTNKCITMTLKDNQLALDIAMLATTLGLGSKQKMVFKQCQNFQGDWYRGITIYGDLTVIPTQLARKTSAERLMNKNPQVSGLRITDIGEGEYYGFAVDKDHLFCLGDGTVTHNTTLINEIIYHWIFHSPHKIGIVSMELSAVQYSKVLLSRHIKVKLDLLKTEEKQKLIRSEETAEAASDLFTDEHGNSRFFLVEDRDSSIEQLQETIEEMVISSGCRVIVLDPLQDVLDGLSNEEQSIFMKWCKSMLKSHGVAIVLINHIRKTEGNEPTENAIHGSSSIIKSAGVNIIIYRDKEAEDEIERNTTHIKVTKNRITGLTGPADELYYENTAHTLHNKEDYFGGDIPVKEKPVPDELKPFDRDLDDDEDQLDY